MQNRIAKSTHAHTYVRISLCTTAPDKMKGEEIKEGLVHRKYTEGKLVHAKLRYTDKSGTGSSTECKLPFFHKQLQ